jgi:ABC-type spermidine/putrescine transport system, permease component II
MTHIVINLPNGMLSIQQQLMGLDRVWYETALELGETPFQALRKVIVPELRPGIAAAFQRVISQNDVTKFIVTNFTKGHGIRHADEGHRRADQARNPSRDVRDLHDVLDWA